MLDENREKFKVTFLHLDLGIGGAERLVIDCATQLRSMGYEVSLLTSHHDIKHCFSETLEIGPFGLRDVIQVR
jgi:alpha-1,3/alpha-1,6-mannosyltransferase